MGKYTHVLWDWNGTLLDDAPWCVKVINIMLVKRGLQPLSGMGEYREVFCFPVIEYYKNVGFDLNRESFEDIAKEYIKLYHSENTGQSPLHAGADKVLRTIKTAGITQAIISASRADNLMEQLKCFNIGEYFDEILGLTDIYAKSKVEVGRDYMERSGASSAVMVGDSVHDYEVARAIGADCLLISNGHQSAGKLKVCPVPVLSDITQVLEYVF